MSEQINKPLFLHQRDAFDDFVSILTSKLPATPINGIVHCFTEDKDKLRTILDLGMYVGVTGWVCDPKRGVDLREAVPYIPLDRLMIETPKSQKSLEFVKKAFPKRAQRASLNEIFD